MPTRYTRLTTLALRHVTPVDDHAIVSHAPDMTPVSVWPESRYVNVTDALDEVSIWPVASVQDGTLA